MRNLILLVCLVFSSVSLAHRPHYHYYQHYHHSDTETVLAVVGTVYLIDQILNRQPEPRQEITIVVQPPYRSNDHYREFYERRYRQSLPELSDQK